MGDIDRRILEDIREALGSIREQIGLIDARLAQLADGLAEGGIALKEGNLAESSEREPSAGAAQEAAPESPVQAEIPSEAAAGTEDSPVLPNYSAGEAAGAEESSGADGPVWIPEPPAPQNAETTLVREPSPESPAATSPAEARRDPARFAWRTDRPGTPVRNILSAISLNDRLLYIKELFAGDPALFQKTISVFNSISSLAEAEAYIRSHFPEWEMDSDTVYRFMMAVRRRLS